MTLREWNPLARRLQAASLRPSDLPAISTGGVPFELSPEERARITALLSRDVQADLEHIASLGIFPITHANSDYPDRYRQRLKDSAPAVLFYAGEKALLGQPGIAVVGSRHLDEAGQECAALVGNACGLSGMVLYSGGAKGVDSISMDAALRARGTAVGVLADEFNEGDQESERSAEAGRPVPGHAV